MSVNSPNDLWLAAENAVVEGNAPALAALLRDHASQFRNERPKSTWMGGLAPDYSPADAHSILAREHQFPDFQTLEQHLERTQNGRSPEAQFEAAVEAVVTGHSAALRTFLEADPSLVHARSPRQHRATLLHYVGANGVESWRQRTPPEILEITRLLLARGAEVDALADMYDGSTTLGLVATSIHPVRAGLQIPLMEVLLDHGAAIDLPGTAGRRGCIVHGCLANGRPGAARFLVDRGAALNLEDAAGVGRLDWVQTCFQPDGTLTGGATWSQALSGLQWACAYGHPQVVEFLVHRGVPLDAMHRGQTALHWTAYGGHADLVRWALSRGTSTQALDETFHGTPLDWALHGWENPLESDSPADHPRVIELLLEAGTRFDPNRLPHEKVRQHPNVAAALARATRHNAPTPPPSP